MFPSPSSIADDEHLAVVARPCAPVGGSSLVREWKAASSISTRPDNGCARGDHAGAQLVGEQPSAAVRADTELFLELQGRDAVGVGRHQVGRPRTRLERQLAGVQDRPASHRGLPAAAGASRCVLFCADGIPFHGRTRDRRSRPASASIMPGKRRRHRPGTCAQGEEAVGDLFHVVAPSAGTYSEHSTRSAGNPNLNIARDRSHPHKRFVRNMISTEIAA